MNIFVLHRSPETAAQQVCDKHCVKMILESAQLMCTSVIECGGEAHYKSTHRNHPSAIWSRQTKENFNWLKAHALALCKEYTRRYGKIHKSQAVIESLTDELIPEGKLTPFAQAMPEQYRNKDVVKAYRDYYIGEKSRIAKWKLGNVPEWWKEKENGNKRRMTKM